MEDGWLVCLSSSRNCSANYKQRDSPSKVQDVLQRCKLEKKETWDKETISTAPQSQDTATNFHFSFALISHFTGLHYLWKGKRASLKGRSYFWLVLKFLWLWTSMKKVILFVNHCFLALFSLYEYYKSLTRFEKWLLIIRLFICSMQP